MFPASWNDRLQRNVSQSRSYGKHYRARAPAWGHLAGYLRTARDAFGTIMGKFINDYADKHLRLYLCKGTLA